MKISKKICLNSCVICVLFLGLLHAVSSDSMSRLNASAVSPLRDRPQLVRAITTPSSDITLSYVQPGRIEKVHFVEGQWVKAGQVLVRQDDSVEQIQLAQLRAASEDTTQIQASDASLAQKKVDLEKIQKAAAQNAVTELEVEHAKLSVTMAGLSLNLAKFEHEQAGRKYDEIRVQLEKMRLVSPVDGRIEKIHVEAGESINALTDVVRVVKIDPLWIDVPVPLDIATDLSISKKAIVVFPSPNSASVEGSIIFISAVADAASGTLRVRIEVPNKSNRPAGEHVEIMFPALRK
ncbi:MAG: efflux RND transporter periplasmic adaptor subunit [Sedimentisphaerales bacterium]|nr:efflux RND transporter periplasmic adaptor subunit [Sedimentisphaerales bacterium]